MRSPLGPLHDVTVLLVREILSLQAPSRLPLYPTQMNTYPSRRGILKVDQLLPRPRTIEQAARAARHPRTPMPEIRPGRQMDWELRLRRTLKEWSHRKFEWGTSDCVHFACACIHAMTGENHLAEIATYKNEYQALQVLASIDHRCLQQAVEVVLGPSIDIGGDPSQFCTGDVVLTVRPVIGSPHRRGPGLGVIVRKRSMFVGAAGLEEVATKDCVCGWRIG